MPTFSCEKCSYETSHKGSYDNHLKSKRHLKTQMDETMDYICVKCMYETNDSSAYAKHCKTGRHYSFADETIYMCECTDSFHSAKALLWHRKKCKQKPPTQMRIIEPPTPEPPTPEQQEIQKQSNLVLQIIDSVSANIYRNKEPSSSDTVSELIELKRQNMELTKQNNAKDVQITTMCKLIDSSLMGCAFCEEKSRLLEYHSDQYGQHSICKECVLKSTGYSSIRPEIIMREFLKSRYNKPMLRANQWIKGEACTKYRPDTMYADPNRVLTVECDESQHTGKSYLCEDKRVSEMYDEYPGKTAIWIRFNSGSCSHPDSANKSMDVRLEELLDLMRAIETMEFDTMIHVFYMYYSPENPNITNQFSKTMIN